MENIVQDDEILQVMRSVKLQEPLGKEAEVQAYASVMSELSVIDGVLLRGERLVVPNKLQENVVEIAHEGHVMKTKSYLRSRLWFPGMDIMTERVIRGCMLCQIATPQISRLPLKMTPLPNETMEKVAADFYGPLPTGEYLLLVTCKYSRYPFIEVVNHIGIYISLSVVTKGEHSSRILLMSNYQQCVPNSRLDFQPSSGNKQSTPRRDGWTHEIAILSVTLYENKLCMSKSPEVTSNYDVCEECTFRPRLKFYNKLFYNLSLRSK